MNDGIRPDAAALGDLILVGADGFIGSVMHRQLTGAGRRVHPAVFARSPRSGEIRLDVTRPEDFENLPPGIPVVNAAGLPDQSLPARRMRRVHVDGMRNLIRWARRTGCPHLLHLSSVAVYGNATVGTDRRESNTRRRGVNPLVASLPYGRTKARAEALLERSGLPWSAPRLPAVFGPGDSFITGAVHRLLREPRVLPAGGTAPVSIFPVEEIGPLVMRILDHGPLNAALNAVGAHMPWIDILAEYAAAWDLPLRLAPRRRFSDFLGFLDFGDPARQMAVAYGMGGADFPDDELRRRLGWTPRRDWIDAVREAAAAWAAPAPRQFSGLETGSGEPLFRSASKRSAGSGLE